jgi:outer membrane biosynthesis protein TonB
MSLRRTFGIGLLLALLLALMLVASGCEVKKKKPNVPQQAQAPVLMPTTTDPASTQPGPPPPASVEPARPLPTPGEVASNLPPEEPVPKPARRAPRRSAPPKKTVVENTPPEPAPTPPTTQPQPTQQGQLTASVSHNDALQQKVDTQQLLHDTESNLRGLTRTLSSDEQVMVAHIRSYIQQSNTATGDGDLERAYNLALKARLLSDELVKK